MVVHPLAGIVLTIWSFNAPEVALSRMAHTPAFIEFKVVYWAVALICSAADLLAGWALWKKHQWKSVRLTIAVLWLIGPLSCVAVSLHLHLLFSSAVWNDFLEKNAWFLIRSFLWAALWTAYLLKSVRVKNTYAREPMAPALT